MTEEEKRAFLATALSAGMTPESRKPLMKPQRMEKASASPFPTDSILRNFVSGKVQQQKKDVSLSAVTLDLNTDAKKKAYLDLVTDPDRFTRRVKPKPTTSSTQSTPVPPEAPSQAASSNLPWLQPQQPETPQQYVNGGGLDDLGARLGVYAMEEEVRRRETERQRAREKQEQEERERMLIIRKQEAEQRAAEVARRQQMALLQVEEQVRRKEEEVELRKKEDEMAAEQERLAALIQQQEAYWTERLAKEREAKARREAAAAQEARKQKEQTFEQQLVEQVQQQPSYIATQPEPENESYEYPANNREFFNPNEMDLLDEVGLQTRVIRNVSFATCLPKHRLFFRYRQSTPVRSIGSVTKRQFNGEPRTHREFHHHQILCSVPYRQKQIFWQNKPGRRLK